MTQDLYRQLVASMRQVFAEVNALTMRMAGAEALAMGAEIDRLTAEFDLAWRARDREALKATAQRRRDLRFTLYPLLSKVRRDHAAVFRPIYGRIGRKATCETYQLRCKAVKDGMHWATANAVLDSALQAWKMAIKGGAPPREPEFERRGQDCLSLQFPEPGGLPVSLLLDGAIAELQILPIAGCGDRKYGQLRFRVGVASANTYATGTWQYHRPLPLDARVSQARLVCRHIGKDDRYFLQLLVNVDGQVGAPVRRKKRSALAAIHFGWAADPAGRRVAGICDSADPADGQILRLPPEVEAVLARASAIQNERWRWRDEIALRLGSLDMEGWPAELKAEGEVLRALPVPNVALRALHHLFRGLVDAGIQIEDLEAWRQQDRMRWQAVTHMSRRARMRRRALWRQTAIDLARDYRAVAIESLDLAEVARVVDPDSGDGPSVNGPIPKSGRSVAGISELEKSIRWACHKTGTPLIEVVGYSTSICAYCRGAVVIHNRTRLTVKCKDCGRVADRKLNGAAVSWQAAEAELEHLVDAYDGHVEKAATAAREAHRAKLERMAAARPPRAPQRRASSKKSSRR